MYRYVKRAQKNPAEWKLLDSTDISEWWIFIETFSKYEPMRWKVNIRSIYCLMQLPKKKESFLRAKKIIGASVVCHQRTVLDSAVDLRWFSVVIPTVPEALRFSVCTQLYTRPLIWRVKQRATSSPFLIQQVQTPAVHSAHKSVNGNVYLGKQKGSRRPMQWPEHRDTFYFCSDGTIQPFTQIIFSLSSSSVWCCHWRVERGISTVN